MMLLKNIGILVVTGTLCLGFCGCGGGEKKTEETMDTIAESAHPDANVGKPAESGVAAQVGERTIYFEELDKEVENLFSRMGGSIPKEQVDSVRSAFRSQTLDHMVNQTVLLAEARRQELKIDNAMISAKIDEVRTGWPDPPGFDKHLETIGIDEDKFRELIEESLLIESLLEKEIPVEGQEPTEEEIVAYYESNPEVFQIPEKIRASHVLLKVGGDDGTDVRLEKQKELLAVLEKVNAGENFADMAKEHSDCPSSAEGGDLGFFSRGQMVKPFEDAAFTLAVNEISDIIETDFGFHIIKVTDKHDARTLPLEEIRDKVTASLTWKDQTETLRVFIEKLRSAVSISYAPGLEPKPGT